jgi:hypothetical protein
MDTEHIKHYIDWENDFIAKYIHPKASNSKDYPKPMSSLDCCAMAPIKNAGYSEESGLNWHTKTDTQENTMYTDNIKVTKDHNAAREYLNKRAYDVRNAKEIEASNYFNMGYQPYPKNGKELKEWFANGRVVLSDDLKDDEKFGWSRNAMDYIDFIDPDKKEDKKGFEETYSLIFKDYQKVKDTVNVLSAEEGLKAFNDFEAKVYH